MSKENQLLTYGMIGNCEVRAIDETARTAEFVAATETGVDTWSGKEYLKMSGARLQRYRSNPVVLDAHDRYSADAIVGRADVKIEGKQLAAKVTFATTTRAESVWQLVKGGFLRALSVGFMPDANRIQRLSEGEVSGEGEDEIKGPARIVKGWELYEISVVPVPADANALRRALQSGDSELLRSLTNIIERLTTGVERNSDMEEKDNKTPENPSPENKGAEKPETRQPSEIERRALDIRAVAPRGMERLADELVASGATVDEACKRFLKELQGAAPPAGTPEPKQPEKQGEQKRTVKDIGDDELTRALLG